MEKIAIIGTGLSGSYLAYLLKNKYEVHCFDKARGDGGRSSSKRIDGSSFDFGLSYFKINNSELKKELESDVFSEVLTKWQAKVLEIDKYDSTATEESVEEYYTAKPFASSLCKKFLEGIEYNHKLHKVLEIIKTGEKNYSLKIEKDESELEIDGFAKVICTAPNVQSAEITKNFTEISSICLRAVMSSNFVVLLSSKDTMKSSEQVLNSDIIKITHSPISDIVFNHKKPDRNSEVTSIVIKANHFWSKSHIEIDKENLKKLLTEECLSLCGIKDLEIDFSHIHRWLYSETLKPALEIKDFRHEDLFIRDSLPEDKSEQIYVCGDWCIGSYAEDALLSAKSLADYLSL